MAARTSLATQAMKKLRVEAQAIDNRRQLQIRNQVATINRLMQGGSYDEEMANLHEQLADVQAKLDEALVEMYQTKGV